MATAAIAFDTSASAELAYAAIAFDIPAFTASESPEKHLIYRHHVAVRFHYTSTHVRLSIYAVTTYLSIK